MMHFQNYFSKKFFFSFFPQNGLSLSISDLGISFNGDQSDQIRSLSHKTFYSSKLVRFLMLHLQPSIGQVRLGQVRLGQVRLSAGNSGALYWSGVPLGRLLSLPEKVEEVTDSGKHTSLLRCKLITVVKGFIKMSLVF